MGLFDRIFSVGPEKQGQDESATELAPSAWQPDPAADEAVDRHHDAIIQRLAEHGEQAEGTDMRRGSSPHAGHGVGWDDHDGLDQVIDRLEAHSDPHVRALAARTLAMMPGRTSMEALARALEDPEPIVRDAARDALTHLGVRTLTI